ncbi:MAG: hypothetical protein AAFX50_01475 [Acidobacteriota bacterium]
MRQTCLICLALALLAGPAFGAPEEPQVFVDANGSDVIWAIEGFDYGLATLTITGPRKIDALVNVGRGEKPTYTAIDDRGKAVDGFYRWDLMVRSYLSEEILERIAKDRLRGSDEFACQLEEEGTLKSFHISGSFQQIDGRVVLPKEGDEERSEANSLPNKDFVINDDLIVDGSACIGFDCVNGESFGFDTLRLKENNLRIKFQDTSSTASFPSTDWQLTANDSANGGANKFSIDDVTASRTIFTVEGNAPSNSLYVDDGGRIGSGTATPVADLHIKDGDSPTVRLEQDGSSGFAPQTWDVAGNEANFFIRDATNGSMLPFRIRPGAPSASIFIDTDGDVGLNTTSPDGRLAIVDSAGGNSDMIYLENDGKITIRTDNTDAGAIWDFSNDGAFNISRVGSGTNEFRLNDAGTLTITGSLIAQGGDGTTDPGDTFPDYVFAPEYDLMTIQDLEKFVTANRHLPNVPSASDISAAGGINMTELQLRMLEKVEELALYTIDQQKTLDRQEETIEAQAEVIRRLTERLDAMQID